jgi:hypothetical protein
MKSVLTIIILITILGSFALGQTAKLDMIDWMTMDPFGMHLTGSRTSMWSVVDSTQSQFYWVKGTNGYPWDVKKWDANYIYDTITEVNWTNPRSYKRHIGPTGKGYPLTTRFVTYRIGDTAKKLSTITTPPSGTNFEIHSSCTQFTKSNLGYAKAEVWGPFYESIGGDLPPNMQTLHLNWLWSCDSSYKNCKTKEVFTLAQVYGMVRWQNYKLVNGQYSLMQTGLKNVLVSGTGKATHPCWK